MSAHFAAAVATGDPVSLVARCVAGIPALKGANLGILYLSEPAASAFPQLVRALAERTGIHAWVGGLVSHRCASPLLDRTSSEEDGLGGNGFAGLMLAPGIAVATGLTQGCTPIGPVHRIDEARDNVVMVIDGRPALAVFTEDIGPGLAGDLRRIGGLIFAGLPVPGSDTGDYLVRNLMAIDPSRGWLVLGEEIAAGASFVFFLREPACPRAAMASIGS